MPIGASPRASSPRRPALTARPPSRPPRSFCIEVSRTLVEQGVHFTYYRLDLFTGEVTQPALHEALRARTGQRTVPYVFVHSRLLGGCDATKASVASGEFDKLVGSAGEGADVEAGPAVKAAGVDVGATPIVGALLEFPNTVDGRVIRLVATQVFIISVILAALAYQEKTAYAWLAVGLLTDFCLRFYAGAGISPLGSLAMLGVALWDWVAPALLGHASGPVWGAGPPKQFAVAVGVFFSAAIVVFQFTGVWPAATACAAVLAFFAGLEAFVNFCAGCWVFGHGIRLGVVPDSVYIVHINTLPETKLVWADFARQRRVGPPPPVRHTERFKRHPAPTRIDAHYKTGKGRDWELEDFAYVRNSKIMFFSAVIGVAALPALFKFMSMSPRFATPPLVWEILTLLSLLFTVVFAAPYLVKALRYPAKIRQEWWHPGMNNAFSIPSMTLVVYAFLAWDTYSTALARVLFWAGASTAFALALVIVGNNLSTVRHPGHFNGAWMMAPVGLYIAAVVGPIVDPSYTQVSYAFFGLAAILHLALFTLGFQAYAFLPGYTADPRQRMFSAIWAAAPAVASIAWTVLTSPPGAWSMDPIAQTLFYVAVGMALLNVWMAWRRFLWIDQFFMGMWAFGFPTVALAWAAVLYDATVATALTKILACVCIAAACIVVAVLTARTLAGVARRRVFIPEAKWGPMSHLPLAQDAMRELVGRCEAAAGALAATPGNTRLLGALRASWRQITDINTFYATIKRDICFPQIGTFFPGHADAALAANAALLEAQARVGAAIDGNGGKVADPGALAAEVAGFGALLRSTFDHVEDHIKPVVRRYLPGPVQKKIMLDCWDDAPAEGWWVALPAVVAALPMQSQRLTYLRAFLWAMPERAQQIGTMVALGVDPVTWYRLRHQMPELIPRGEAGFKKF